MLKRIFFRSSITQFLIVGVLSLTTVYVALVYVFNQRQAVHEIEELFDAQLAHSSYVLLNLLSDSVSTIDQTSNHLPVIYHGLEHSAVQSKNALFYQKKVAYQIYNRDRKLLVKSASAPDRALVNETRGGLAFSQEGYTRNIINGESWRVFSLYDEDWDFWLHVAESEFIREELAKNMAQQTLWPSLALMPLVLLLLIVVIRLGLTPLKNLTQAIYQRDSKNLSSINLDTEPKEIKPVLQAINGLFHRLDDAITREKRLTADAAHELRTPLAVVMIHAQNALKATDDAARHASLLALEKSTSRISRLLEQLLTLSKINPETIPLIPIAVLPICENTIAQLAPKIFEQDQDIELLAENQNMKQLKVLGSEFLVEVLLSNLIDNASCYSPKGGKIRVGLECINQAVVISVEDSGVGVAEQQYAQLTQRFFRIVDNEQSDQYAKGVGLGLSLVQAITSFHQGEIHFYPSRLGGLGVKVTLPLLAS